MTINYSVVLPFEQGFDPVPSTVWMQQYWAHSITLSVAYALIIFVGQRLMLNKPTYSLKTPLTLWNFALAIFSILGCIRMSPEFVYVLRNFGFKYSICNPSFAQGVTGFWTEMFAVSKAFELIDTLFIVLRKRPLIFLHWYHHITVLVYTWHAYKDHTASGRWFVWMNYTVHSLMYTYYAFRSLGWRFPRFVPMSVTVLQLAQMVIGVTIAIVTYSTKLQGEFCQQTYSNLYFSFLIYFSYFLLFGHFFYNAYFKTNKYVDGKKEHKLANGEHKMANGDHKMANGDHKIANGDHKLANGDHKVANGDSADHLRPRTKKAQKAD